MMAYGRRKKRAATSRRKTYGGRKYVSRSRRTYKPVRRKRGVPRKRRSSAGQRITLVIQQPVGGLMGTPTITPKSIAPARRARFTG